MSIVVHCTCGRSVMFPDDHAGRQGKCPACSRQFIIQHRRSWMWGAVAAGVLGLLGVVWGAPKLLGPGGGQPQAGAPGDPSKGDAAPAADEAGDDMAAALKAEWSDESGWRLDGQINQPGDVDFIHFAELPAGSWSFDVKRTAAEPAELLIQLLGEDRGSLQRATLAADQPSVVLSHSVEQPSGAFLKIVARDKKTAAYSVALQVTPDVPDTTEGAVALDVPAEGETSVEGRIDSLSDADVYRFDSPADGRMTARLAALDGESLDPHLTLLNGEFLYMKDSDDGPLGVDSLIEIDIPRGKRYYLRATSTPNRYDDAVRKGRYRLSVVFTPFTDDVGDASDSARMLTFAADRTLQFSGRLERADDVDVFQFNAPEAGDYLVQVTPVGILEAGHTLLDEAGNVLPGTSANFSSPSDSQMRYYSLAANQRCSLRVTGGVRFDEYQTAGYELQIRPYSAPPMPSTDPVLSGGPPAPVDFSIYENVSFSGDDAGTSGTIAAGGQQLFRLLAPRSGPLKIRALQGAIDNLDPMITVYGPDRSQLDQNDDGFLTIDAEVTITASESSEYFVAVYASPGARSDDLRAGTFLLLAEYQSATPPAGMAQGGADFDNAEPLPFVGLSTTSYGTVALGQSRVYRFTAPQAGSLKVSAERSLIDDIDPMLTVYNAARIEIATNDDAPSNIDAETAVTVEAFQDYFVSVYASPSATRDELRSGDFTLRLQFVDAQPVANLNLVAADFDLAEEVFLFGDSGSASGSVSTGGARLHRFTAPQASTITIKAAQGQFDDLDPMITVYNSARTEVGTNDDGFLTTDAEYVLNAEASAVYYIAVYGSPRASREELRAGDYTLSLTVGTAMAAAAASTALNPTADAAASSTGALDFLTRELRYTATAPVTGTMFASVRADSDDPAGPLDPLVVVQDSFGQELARNDDILPGVFYDGYATFEAQAGATYTVIVMVSPGAPAGRGAGRYTVTVGVPAPPTEDTKQ